ncbi:replication initiation protein [Helicobacter mehlei]|uniref:Replication initiation protein n=1 Tax=Helicobacter mehlei TaxID=2316080 RepID=A0A553UKU2_9HELI|nr:replication initiation protein [Helicobacter mehlei]
MELFKLKRYTISKKDKDKIVNPEQQKQALIQQLHGLQALINAETNTTLKGVLEQEKAECLQKLLALAPQHTKLPSSTQDQTTTTNTLEQQPTTSPTTTETPIRPTQQPITTEVITQSAATIPNAIAEKYVAFHNDVNSVSLGKLGTLEANLLFAIFHKLKDKQDELLVVDLDEIKKMTHAVKISHSDLSGVVKRLWKNISNANFWILLPQRDENYMLFKTFAINYYDTKKTQVKSMEIQVNMPYFGYLLNYLNGNFTSFELLEFQNISGKYAKTLYRLLKQWKNIGVPPKMEWEKFRELMGIPKKIKLIRVIEYEILKPALKELNKLPHFKNLCYEKLKTKGMGNRITHIQFYFQPITKTSKDRERAKRDLRTIAWEIRSKKAVKQLKKSMEQAKQTKLDNEMLEVIDMAFYKPQDPSVVLVVDGIQPAKDGYEILVKYYREGKEFQAKSAVLANKETFLTAMANGGYKIVNSQAPQMQQTPQQTPQPKEVKIELQTDKNGFKTFQGLTMPNTPNQAPQPNQPQALNPNNDLTEYIGRNLYMSNNGVPAVLKIKDITYTETNKLRVDIQDIDKPHKILNPFILDNVKHFKSWFKKYAE